MGGPGKPPRPHGNNGVAARALAALASTDSDSDDDAPPAVRSAQHVMVDSPAGRGGRTEPQEVAPYLIAPTFRPPPPGRKRPPEAQGWTAAAVGADPSADVSSIEHAVTKAYQKVRWRRNEDRAKLVAKALKEDRDAVIDGILGNGKPEGQHVGSEEAGGAPNGSNGRKRKRRHIKHGNEGDSPGKSETSPAKSTPATLVFPRLPSNNCPVEVFAPQQLGLQWEDDTSAEAPSEMSKPNGGWSSYTLTIKEAGENKSNAITTTTYTHQPLHIEGCHPPRPKQSAIITLNSSFAVEDEPSLAHVPYFGDGNDEDIYSELFDVQERKRLYERGPPYRQQETQETIDDMLREMAKRKPKLLEDVKLCEKATMEELRDGSQSNAVKLGQIHSTLAKLAGVDVEMVRKRHLHRLVPAKGEESKPAREDLSHKKNSDVKVAVPYESIANSYRDLHCRRCFTFDCNIHGNLPKANLDLLSELAVQKERDGHWKEIDADLDTSNASNSGEGNEYVNGNSDDGLTPAQQSMCEHAYTIFQGDVEQIAAAIEAAPSAVAAFVKAKTIALQPNKYLTAQQPSKKSGRSYTSMNNYNPRWLRNIQSKTIQPSFLPCDHDEPCNDETCSCIQNGFFCTKACGWSSKSPNFFRGCECKGQCLQNSCSCVAANRECDPDLCKTCGACSDPPGAPAGDGQRCRNDNISMQRSACLLLSESTIEEAGWGLFTDGPLKRGDFVVEYVGEVISQEEAERRGVIYDKMNMSYLFNLSSDFTVDATRKGNLARYANHSTTPNIEPRMIQVNGDMRIGFFAKQDIAARSELFFNYEYNWNPSHASTAALRLRGHDRPLLRPSRLPILAVLCGISDRRCRSVSVLSSVGTSSESRSTNAREKYSSDSTVLRGDPRHFAVSFALPFGEASGVAAPLPILAAAALSDRSAAHKGQSSREMVHVPSPRSVRRMASVTPG
ncbi:hypothetical protein ACHAXT_011360 [Thalassiosira profunda]